ncbi:MAG: hypothetical protein D6771_09360 [Zetaproteobacteria bacterium]|nr:MAG: hypothetical protein D6771_09360 [Zetaproteobacteria bacterium]
MARPNLEEAYLRFFKPRPDAVRKGCERAFEIYRAWTVRPAEEGGVALTATSTRDKDLAVFG